MYVSVTRIVPTRERNPEEGTLQERNPVDSKVRGFVLERISHTKGGLLPSASAPQIVIDLIPSFETAKMDYVSREKSKPTLRKTPLKRRIPIGLLPVDSEGWVNALMQFILFIPGFVELFYFAPRSFYLFQEFFDQYSQDQQDNRSQSSANGTAVFRFLKHRLPSSTMEEVFQFFLRILYPKWELHRNLDEALLSERVPTDLFISESSLKKQYFADLNCYDLDAFIEMRPDGLLVNYITYVKLEGGWYQCDEDRITQIRSNHLSAPLNRAILLHYKKVVLTF